METINKNKNIFSILIIIIFVFLCFFLIKNNSSKNLEVSQIQSIKIAGKVLKVELALTSAAQEQGLSGREILKEDESMLFVFDHIDKYSFWMKDMKFPLDIIWISDDYHVVYIKKNATPLSYPESFSPEVEARYVLEVNAGFSEKNNLKVGDEVHFFFPLELAISAFKRGAIYSYFKLFSLSFFLVFPLVFSSINYFLEV